MSFRRLMVRTSIFLALGLATLSFAGQASAGYVSTAKVVRVRSYATGTTVKFDIWFDRDVAAHCTAKSRVTVASTNALILENVRSVAIAAMLSGREVEVNTPSTGCSGDNGLLEYISLK